MLYRKSLPELAVATMILEKSADSVVYSRINTQKDPLRNSSTPLDGLPSGLGRSRVHIVPMTELDVEKFEDKYVHYFTELQKAYKNAFEEMNDTYDSELVHAIDQLVLNESEPFFDEQSGFSIQLPATPFDRVRNQIIVDQEKFEHVLERYVATIEDELEDIFDY